MDIPHPNSNKKKKKKNSFIIVCKHVENMKVKFWILAILE